MSVLAFVGSRTTRERNARGEGISVLRVADDGTLARVHLQGGLVNPSFLALNRRGDRLYTVHGDQHEVSAFAVDEDGKLAFLNQVGCGGRNPVHLALDPSERFLVVPNHLDGTLAVLSVKEDGALGELLELTKLPGVPGPHRIEQPFSKPHFNPFDPSGRFVLVPDKGLDRVFSFRFDAGRLVPAAQPWAQAREGAGPRNLAFHPVLPVGYVLNELDSTLATCGFDAESGALQPRHLLTTLPATFTGHSRGAQLQVDPSGRFLHASNRGHDSIALFTLDAQGTPAFVEAFSSGGRTPRFIALGPVGDVLYALNEDSDRIAVLPRDPASGRLGAPRQELPCGSPVCMVFRASARS
ncbi:MAG TPA: lactonase family protein [Ramlibacter sp.]|uniref:lactonase family protein n=1 Tax=Ramlibacter sp. TaxID=1917967 RepID=UPI002ED3E169